MKKAYFYAVQYGDNFDWDNGSADYNEAERMAEELANDSAYDGLEIRIATIDEADSFCTEEVIVREGRRV